MTNKADRPFSEVAATPENANWEKLTARSSALYNRADDVRSPFARDYTRILHSTAYRRLKHKTQVFYNIDNDHICTRMEHVAHVESVSSTIASNLGLNTELTKAIAMGHDLGHAPFGHHGETILTKLCQNFISKDMKFWHEKNGLYFVDKVELLADNYNDYKNLDLTYAVRDGIISHCGEVDENGTKPRTEFISLEEDFKEAGQYAPITWEGCVVKLSDKIAYVGRDIEDAIQLGFIDDEAKHTLKKMAQANDINAINTTVIMHNLIIDVCQNSSPKKGICLSDKFLAQLNTIKKFNYDTAKRYYPLLISSFEKWLAKYCVTDIVPAGELRSEALNCENIKIYGSLETNLIYAQAIIDFIAGMTDRFAVKLFNELISY